MEVRSCVWCVLLLGFALGDAKYFKFEDCSKNGTIAQVSNLQMNPDPINMKKNMTVNAIVKILRDVPEEAVLKTRYYKIKDVFGVKFDVPIPCILGKFGSCTIPLCDYLEFFKDQAETVWPEDKEYGCPVTAGDYGGENIEVPMPYIPTIARIVVSEEPIAIEPQNMNENKLLISRCKSLSSIITGVLSWRSGACKANKACKEKGKYRTELKILDKRGGKELACYKIWNEIR